MDPLESISPLEYRYLTARETGNVRSFLSEEAFIRYLAKVEAALVRAYCSEGLCCESIAVAVEEAATAINAQEVYAEEKRMRHQLRAVVNCLGRKAGNAAMPWIHLGATSHDIICTADSLRYRDYCARVLIPQLDKLATTLIELARREKSTLQIGRTHGQHAVPCTFGFAIAEYVSRLGGRIAKLQNCATDLRGQFSGAVGAYNAQKLLLEDPLAFEQKFLASLNLKPGIHSTQIVEPEYLLDLQHAVVSAFGVLANLADDMRHLQRSEIAEVAECFTSSQVGSSTMPHKQNPINFEHVKSLWKTFMPRMTCAYLDQISEHQRDLSNSASSRFVGELLCGLYLAGLRMEKTIARLVVKQAALATNLRKNWHRIIAEPCYIILAQNGHPHAHESVKQCTRSGSDLLQFLQRELGRELSTTEKELFTEANYYQGIASKKTEIVCNYWEEKLRSFRHG